MSTDPKDVRIARLVELGARMLHDWEPRKGPTGEHGRDFLTCHNDDCQWAKAACRAVGIPMRGEPDPLLRKGFEE